jgi:DNA-binding NarL/FixJ family response regulator
MVTAGMTPLDVSVAKKLGISGIFLKHSPPASLLEAIRVVAGGGVWMDPKMTPVRTGGANSESSASTHLTPREQKVLRCVFEGLSNKEMAHQLGVSQSSVKATLQHLFDKMGVRTRGQLVRIAIERSLETVQQP